MKYFNEKDSTSEILSTLKEVYRLWKAFPTLENELFLENVVGESFLLKISKLSAQKTRLQALQKRTIHEIEAFRTLINHKLRDLALTGRGGYNYSPAVRLRLSPVLQGNHLCTDLMTEQQFMRFCHNSFERRRPQEEKRYKELCLQRGIQPQPQRKV